MAANIARRSAGRALRLPATMSIRNRVLLAVSMLSVLSLLLAGMVAYALERQRLAVDIDQLLLQRHGQLVAVTERGTDPNTGAPLTSTAGLLRAAMSLTLPGTHDGGLGLIDGRPVLPVAAGRAFRLAQDPGLLQAVSTPRDAVVLQSMTTSKSTYRVIVVPVTMAGDPQHGTFVWAVDTNAEYAELNDSYRTFIVVGIGTLIVVGLVAWLMIGQLLDPIRLVRQTAQRITRTDLSGRIPIRGHDELAELSTTVNGMLDRLEKTFLAQGNLFDDIGHELKTPLTVMRGNLEVMDAADPEDVAATRQRVISEVSRMSRLVEELLTLAKTDRPDFIQPQVIDVGALTDETLEKATTLGDRRWVLQSVSDDQSDLDPERMAQALLELARNAVKFSEPGSVIAMGSASVDDRVHFWVRDHGRGIPPDQLESITERHTRVDPLGIEGSGLGLAIVTSIVDGHDGRVLIESTEGEGTTVTLDLPRQRARSAPAMRKEAT